MASGRVHLGINVWEVKRGWKEQSKRQNANLKRVSTISVAKASKCLKKDTGTTCMEHLEGLARCGHWLDSWLCQHGGYS